MTATSISTLPTEACDVSYGQYMYLKLAKLSCAADSDCVSVVDDRCDLQSPFQLCRKHMFKGVSNISTCIEYTKMQGTQTETFESILIFFYHH